MLGIYSLVRHWACTVIGDRPDLAPQRASFEAACAVIDLFLQAKRGSVSGHEAGASLVTAVCRHIRLHLEAYGTDHVKPKHHWMLDCAIWVRKHGIVLDAFILERLHLRVKRQEMW